MNPQTRLLLVAIHLGLVAPLCAAQQPHDASSAVATQRSVDPLEAELESYIDASPAVATLPPDKQQASYSLWLQKLQAAAAATADSPKQRQAKATICSLHNALGNFAAAESACIELANTSGSDAETIKWYADAGEFALRQSKPWAGHDADLEATVRADKHLSLALAIGEAARPEPAAAAIPGLLRAYRLAMHLKDEHFSQPQNALSLARNGRQLAQRAPAELARTLDDAFAGVEAFASFESVLLTRLGQVDQALAAVDSMASVATPKQPRSFYADRVASLAEELAVSTRVKVLRTYLSTRPTDSYSPAVKHNYAVALLQEGSRAEGVQTLRDLLADRAGIQAIDARQVQRGFRTPGEPGWTDSAEFLLGEALAADNNPQAVEYLRGFAQAFPADSRAEIARGLLKRFGK